MLMAFRILRDIVKNINKSILFSIMTSEITDYNNHEQFVVCFCWVDKNYEAHKDFAGIFKVDNIKLDTLASAMKHILIRLNISLLNARGQCYYNGA